MISFQSVWTCFELLLYDFSEIQSYKVINKFFHSSPPSTAITKKKRGKKKKKTDLAEKIMGLFYYFLKKIKILINELLIINVEGGTP